MATAIPGNASSVSLTTTLYLATKTLHVEAERSGVIRDMLRGQASRAGYILLMRNLLPVYHELEHGLLHYRHSPGLAALSGYRIEREAALEADLLALAGPDWAKLPLLPASDAYARRVADIATGDGAALIAHAYTRYLGDLSGGQILRKLLARTPGLSDAELSFYDWPLYPDLVALKTGYRAALDEAGDFVSDRQRIIDEASVAFTLNIDLSWAVQKALAPTTGVQ